MKAKWIICTSLPLLIASFLAGQCFGEQLLEPDVAEKQELLSNNSSIESGLQLPEPDVDEKQELLGNNSLVESGTHAKGGAHCCPSGWMTYLDSCYLYVRKRLQFPQAEQFCYQRESTLFVANTKDEWDSIRIHGTLGFCTWIGLRVVSAIKPIRSTWETASGMDPDILPWLNKLSGHGWTEGFNCAGYFHPYVEGSDYVFYYPCTNENYFICELNKTEIALAISQKAPPIDPTWWWS